MIMETHEPELDQLYPTPSLNVSFSGLFFVSSFLTLLLKLYAFRYAPRVCTAHGLARSCEHYFAASNIMNTFSVVVVQCA